MAEYVIMPSEDYVEACDKLRELEGSAEPVKSGDLAAKLQEANDTIALQNDLITQLEAALDGKAGKPEFCSITIWAGKTGTRLRVYCPSIDDSLDGPYMITLYGNYSDLTRTKITVPKNTVVIIVTGSKFSSVLSAYRCKYEFYPGVDGGFSINPDACTCFVRVDEDGAQITIE